MNNLQWYLIGILVVIVVLTCLGLWWSTGTTKAKQPPVCMGRTTPLIALRTEPTYKISEEYGRYRTRCISTEYGESWEYSEHPGVFYQVWRWVDDDWWGYDQVLSLSKAEEILMKAVAHDAEKKKVRPSWEYRKDGSPYP